MFSFSGDYSGAAEQRRRAKARAAQRARRILKEKRDAYPKRCDDCGGEIKWPNGSTNIDDGRFRCYPCDVRRFS